MQWIKQLGPAFSLVVDFSHAGLNLISNNGVLRVDTIDLAAARCLIKTDVIPMTLSLGVFITFIGSWNYVKPINKW